MTTKKVDTKVTIFLYFQKLRLKGDFPFHKAFVALVRDDAKEVFTFLTVLLDETGLVQQQLSYLRQAWLDHQRTRVIDRTGFELLVQTIRQTNILLA